MDLEDTSEQRADAVGPGSAVALPESGQPETPGPAPRRGGPIFVIIAAAVLAFALLGTAYFLMQAQNRAKSGGSQAAVSSESAARKARVVVATDFLKYLFAGDSLGMKTLLTSDAQTAITPAQWNDIASAIPTAAATYDPLTWSSDTTASFAFKVAETTGTIVAGAAAGATGTVDVVLSAGGSVETAKLQLRKEGGSWRVLSLTDQAGTTSVYDAAFVKQLYKDATSQ